MLFKQYPLLFDKKSSPFKFEKSFNLRFCKFFFKFNCEILKQLISNQNNLE